MNNPAWTTGIASPTIRSFVRIACRVCSRGGSYRLARLAAKFGPEITLRDLLQKFSYDCLWRAEAASLESCGSIQRGRGIVRTLYVQRNLPNLNVI